MGFSNCIYDNKRLVKNISEKYDIKATEEDISEIMRNSRVGGIATVWELEDKGKYSTARISTSHKAETGEYVNDFSQYASFVGRAHEKSKDLNVDKNNHPLICVLNSDVRTNYIKEKKTTYHNYTVFDFDVVEFNNKDGNKKMSDKKESGQKVNTKKAEPEENEDEDELPF